MKINRVVINSRDKYKFTQMAFLVDRDDFRTDACMLRVKWLKNKPLVAIDKYIFWWFALAAKSRTKMENKAFQKQISDLVIDVYNEYAEGTAKVNKDIGIQKARIAYTKLEQTERQNKLRDFEYDIRGLLIKYHLPETYSGALAYTVICGYISTDSWSSCEAFIDKPYERIPTGEILIEPHCRFVITAQTSKKDLIQLFNKNIKQIKKLYKTSQYGLINYAKDVYTTIHEKREFYWMNLPISDGGQGKSYTTIAREKFRRGRVENNISLVSKAIRSYKKNIHRRIEKL